MGGKVVIKFGGGLITDKENMCTPNLHVIDSLVDILSKVEKQIILVHGAGSFGHMKAKKARLAEGRLPGLNQDISIREVREDMLLLNKYVTDSIQRYELDYSTYPPRDWATGNGPHFNGNLPLSDGITVVFGDVVDDYEKEFSILSGDDLMYRYATEIDDVDCVIFAMGGVDGLLKVPPCEATENDLFKTWSPDMNFEGEHATEFDVTGGIGLKVTRASMIAEKGIDVWLVNGMHPERILELVEGKTTIGTKIVSGNC